MASPGEWFPQQFAMGILQAAEARKRADAQLSEMRNQRASENFLAEERLRLGQQQLQSSEAQNEVQAQIAMEKAKLEAERIKMERDATVSRSVSEFGRSGFAFIPTHAADQIPKLMGSFGGGDGVGEPVTEVSFRTEPGGLTDASGAPVGGITKQDTAGKVLVGPRGGGARPPDIATIELPGYGTILQRVGGPGFEKQQAELAKINALTEKYNQDAALSKKRAEVAEFAAEERQKRIQLMEGKFSNDSIRLAHNIREGLRKQADDLSAQLLAAPPGTKVPEGYESHQGDAASLGRKVAADPTYAFPENSKERDLWKRTSEMIEAGLSAQKKGIPLPGHTNPAEAEALGMDDIAFGAVLPPEAAGTRIAGRTTVNGQTTLIGEGGQKFQAGPALSEGAMLSDISAFSEQLKALQELRRLWGAARAGSSEKETLRQQIIKLSQDIKAAETALSKQQ